MGASSLSDTLGLIYSRVLEIALKDNFKPWHWTKSAYLKPPRMQLIDYYECMTSSKRLGSMSEHLNVVSVSQSLVFTHLL